MVSENQYRRPEPAFKGYKNPTHCNQNVSIFIGNEEGNSWKVPDDAQWSVRSQFANNDGGPWNWNMLIKKCNKLKCQKITPPFSPTSCCNLLTDDNPYNVNCNTGEGKGLSCEKHFCSVKETENGDCENKKYFAERSYLNADMGLYLSFGVDQEGMPTDCPGFTGKWKTKKQRMSPLTKCPLNTDVLEDEKTKMHEMVEKYASDNQLWVNDFFKVFQKMTENGYADHSSGVSLNVSSIL